LLLLKRKHKLFKLIPNTHPTWQILKKSVLRVKEGYQILSAQRYSTARHVERARLSGAKIAARLLPGTLAHNAVSQVLIKMAKVVVSLKIMPESPEIDLYCVKKDVMKRIVAFAGETETKTEIEPIAFGLEALKILFVMDEDIGSTEKLEQEVEKIAGVNSVEVIDVRRAVG